MKNLLWRSKLAFLRLKCFFVDHGEEGMELVYDLPDYCPSCLIHWPQECVTIFTLLNGAYCWTVDRDWRWFNALDDFLFKNYRQRMPSWWEY